MTAYGAMIMLQMEKSDFIYTEVEKKIEPDPDNPQYIITVWGVGYKFSNEKRN